MQSTFKINLTSYSSMENWNDCGHFAKICPKCLTSKTCSDQTTSNYSSYFMFLLLVFFSLHQASASKGQTPNETAWSLLFSKSDNKVFSWNSVFGNGFLVAGWCNERNIKKDDFYITIIYYLDMNYSICLSRVFTYLIELYFFFVTIVKWNI